MEVDSVIDENSKQSGDIIAGSLPEGPLLGSFTTNALDKDDKGMQIRSSARVFKKMKLEQELDKKNDEKQIAENTSNNGIDSGIINSSPNGDQPHINLPADKLSEDGKGIPLRASTRVIKKPKPDGVSSTDAKPKKEDLKNDIKKIVRTHWTHEDKLMFFEAVNEYGKDFENIQQHINNKIRKKGATEDQMRSKDHVRQFYNRTFHEVSKHVKFSDGVKKVVQELYGVINYGELHKKLGSVSEKACMKLNELIYRGATVIRSKGKTIRIKTPMCRALIKMNQLDEEYEDVKLPNRVTVILKPKDMTSYLKIQRMAQNPRLKTVLPLQKRLTALLQCLNKRWKTREAIEYEKSIISTNSVTNDCVPTKQECEENMDLLSPPLRLSPPPNTKLELPSINLSDYLTRQTICLTAYERRIGLDTFSDIKLSKRKKSKTDIEQKIDVEQKAEATPLDLRTDKIDVLKIEETETNSCNEADPDASIADVVDDAISSIISLQQTERLDRQTSETSETEEVIKMDVIKQNNKEDIKSDLYNKELQEKIDDLKRGWTEKDCSSLTIGELYLMYGSEASLCLEYSWDTDLPQKIEKQSRSEENFLNKWNESYKKAQEDQRKALTVALSKLISIAKMQSKSNISKCLCGHTCDGKTVIKNGPNVNSAKNKRNLIMDNNLNMGDLQQDEPMNQSELGDNLPNTPIYIQPRRPAENTPTMQQQLNSIQRLKPKFTNRKGRRPRAKQVVVERKLPLLPNNLSGHQIVRMSIISQQSPTVPPESTVTVQEVLTNPEEENSVISTIPSSPSRILKESESEWINAEVADYSLSSLLGHLESPVKNPLTSNTASDFSNEVDAQLHSLLTETSVDFAENFADLAASVANDKKY